MSRNMKIEVKPNMAESLRFLQEEPVVAEILEDASDKVEEAIPGQVQKAKRFASKRAAENIADRARFGRSDRMPEHEVYNEQAENTDRQKREVGVKNMHPEDWIYGTVQKAVKDASKR